MNFKKGFYIFLPIILGSIVGFLISGNIDYPTLLKPPFSPPKILFPIVWSIIYLLMGISYYILKKNYYTDTFKESLVYYTQLIVNLLWSIIRLFKYFIFNMDTICDLFNYRNIYFKLILKIY